jgi:hypothetical protein
VVLNFPSAVHTSAPARAASKIVEQMVPVIHEQVTIRRPESRVTDVCKDPAIWSWEDLRNYVVRSIETIHGPFPREAPKENAIFRSFVDRWGRQAGPIARFVFEDCQGMWRGAPVRVTRFCKASDSYFAAPIAERLQA